MKMNSNRLSNNSRSRKPHFSGWNLASPTAAMRIFEGIGSLISIVLIGSVGSHFSPTYAALISSATAAVVSPFFVFVFAFNLHATTPAINWIFWESVYTGSLGFMFIINTLTMLYSSSRWGHTAWWLATISCGLVCAAFVFDWATIFRLLLRKPNAKHSQDDAQ